MQTGLEKNLEKRGATTDRGKGIGKAKGSSAWKGKGGGGLQRRAGRKASLMLVIDTEHSPRASCAKTPFGALRARDLHWLVYGHFTSCLPRYGHVGKQCFAPDPTEVPRPVFFVLPRRHRRYLYCSNARLVVAQIGRAISEFITKLMWRQHSGLQRGSGGINLCHGSSARQIYKASKHRREFKPYPLA